MGEGKGSKLCKPCGRLGYIRISAVFPVLYNESIITDFSFHITQWERSILHISGLFCFHTFLPITLDTLILSNDAIV